MLEPGLRNTLTQVRQAKGCARDCPDCRGCRWCRLPARGNEATGTCGREEEEVGRRKGSQDAWSRSTASSGPTRRLLQPLQGPSLPASRPQGLTQGLVQSHHLCHRRSPQQRLPKRVFPEPVGRAREGCLGRSRARDLPPVSSLLSTAPRPSVAPCGPQGQVPSLSQAAEARGINPIPVTSCLCGRGQ